MKNILIVASLILPLSASALEITNTKSQNFILLADLGLKCQVVLNNFREESSKKVLVSLQKRNLKVDHVQYNDDDGGKGLTFWVKDEIVRNLNCQIP